MTHLRSVLVLLGVLSSAGAWAQASPSPAVDEDAKWTKALYEGARLAGAGSTTHALEIFEEVAAAYEQRFKDSKTRILSARWENESSRYLAEAAAENRGPTTVVSANWAYAYYLKGYALLDLGQVAEARAFVERAIAMSPRNAQFLSELGGLYQMEENWPMALQSFQLAEAAAQEFSPPNVRNDELSRAWRGIGFVLVAQNQLDDAEKMYRKCLDLNGKDTKALNDLRYVESLKAKAQESEAG